MGRAKRSASDAGLTCAADSAMIGVFFDTGGTPMISKNLSAGQL